MNVPVERCEAFLFSCVFICGNSILACFFIYLFPSSMHLLYSCFALFFLVYGSSNYGCCFTPLVNSSMQCFYLLFWFTVPRIFLYLSICFIYAFIILFVLICFSSFAGVPILDTVSFLCLLHTCNDSISYYYDLMFLVCFFFYLFTLSLHSRYSLF